MAFEDCEPHRINVCIDCVQHLANGEGGCCHADDHGDRPCPTAVRLDRRWRGAESITLGCAEDDCNAGCRDEEGVRPWFTYSACEGCGVNLGGDREHATVWLPRETRPVREFTRNGWTVSVRPDSGAALYVVAFRGAEKRCHFGGPRNGAERWQRVAEFVATLAA